MILGVMPVSSSDTIELPPSEPQPVDRDLFAGLIRTCIERTIADLKDLRVPARSIFAYRADGGVSLEAPNYRSVAVFGRLDQIWRSAEVARLLDYAWNLGVVKMNLGPGATREDWERAAHSSVILPSLLASLDETAIESLVDNGNTSAWAENPQILERVAREMADWYCLPKPLVTAYCPLRGIDMLADLPLRADGVTFRAWSLRDRLVFRSLHDSEFMWDDLKAPTITGTIAEIRLPFDLPPSRRSQAIGDADLPREEIIARLDMLKWGIATTLDTDSPPVEGTCIIMARAGWQVGRLRRDENLRSGPPLTNAGIERCATLIRDFRTAAQRWTDGDLERALWHFGRACVAVLPRDVLLESAIGLDSLLVPGGGEARYRFCLHGVAILSPMLGAPELGELSKELDKIYSERSRSAHGRRSVQPLPSALRARKFLAKAIESIIRLTLDGSLDPRMGSVGEAVQRYVLTKTGARLQSPRRE